MNSQLEIQRNNITVRAFFTAIKASLKRKGMDFLNVDLDSFEHTTTNEDSRYHVKDGIKYYSYNFHTVQMDAETAAAQSEIYRVKPYDFQIYVKNFDGSGYNEICEFRFDDEKRGNGYYYQANRDVDTMNAVV